VRAAATCDHANFATKALPITALPECQIGSTPPGPTVQRQWVVGEVGHDTSQRDTKLRCGGPGHPSHWLHPDIIFDIRTPAAILGD